MVRCAASCAALTTLEDLESILRRQDAADLIEVLLERADDSDGMIGDVVRAHVNGTRRDRHDDATP